MNRVNHQPSFILKSQSFKETSSIYQVFTRDYGVISVISKGARAKSSKHGTLLQPFRALLLSWVGKGELKTLTIAEEPNSIGQLQGISLYCGFYVNELVLALLHKYDAHPALFKAFEVMQKQLSLADEIEQNLRSFEMVLLNEIGYGLVLDQDVETKTPIQADSLYNYQIGLGPTLEKKKTHPDTLLGSTLINLRCNKLANKIELKQAKRLMRRLIDAQLDGKILKSRDLFV